MDGTTSADSRALRRALVSALRRDGHVRSARVAAALEAVPRELFVPGVPLEEVYRPAEAIVTKRIDGVSVSSASAPEVVAIMLEQLDAHAGQHVLEIGAGTGYNAALLAHLVGEHGRIVSVDVDADLVLGARDHLRSAGYSQVDVVHGDGALGYPSQHPYDRIMLTAASNDIAPAWHEQLARPLGRLVMPLAVRGLQRCVVFVSDDDHLVCQSMRGCAFIALRGSLAWGTPRVLLDTDGGRVISGSEEPLEPSVAMLSMLLESPMQVLRSGVWTSVEALREGLHLWLAVHQPGLCTVWGGADLPDLFGLPGARGTLGLLDSGTLVLLAWGHAGQGGRELLILAPRDAEALAEVARSRLREWASAGRPDDAQATIRAYPRGHGPAAARTGEVMIAQRWTSFFFSWSG